MKFFQRLVTFSIFTTFLVILAGAIVRGTGSGLGCPDWPQCFGHWVPPMDLSELPENYKEIYKISGKSIADFDPFKTWTEYLNRLIGVFLGIIIVLLFFISLTLREFEKNLPWFCGGLLFLIILQGGVGALVVSSHLKPYIITLHMFLAILLLFGLLYLKKYCEDLDDHSIVQKLDQKGLRITKILLTLTFVQILIGTQVRQNVDHLMRDLMVAVPENIINQLGFLFYIHRSFSILIVILFIYLLTHFQRFKYNRTAFFLCLMAFFAVMGNVITGITLNYFNFPATAQPPHLFFGVITISLLYSLTLNLKGSLLDD